MDPFFLKNYFKSLHRQEKKILQMVVGCSCLEYMIKLFAKEISHANITLMEYFTKMSIATMTFVSHSIFPRVVENLNGYGEGRGEWTVSLKLNNKHGYGITVLLYLRAVGGRLMMSCVKISVILVASCGI